MDTSGKLRPRCPWFGRILGRSSPCIPCPRVHLCEYIYLLFSRWRGSTIDDRESTGSINIVHQSVRFRLNKQWFTNERKEKVRRCTFSICWWTGVFPASSSPSLTVPSFHRAHLITLVINESKSLRKRTSFPLFVAFIHLIFQRSFGWRRGEKELIIFVDFDELRCSLWNKEKKLAGADATFPSSNNRAKTLSEEHLKGKVDQFRVTALDLSIEHWK